MRASILSGLTWRTIPTHPNLIGLTPPSPPLLCAGATVTPKNVRTRVKSSTAITVQWDGLTPCREVNGLIVEYRVQYTAYSSDIMQSVVHPGNWSVQGAQALLSELTPFTNYSIKVAAVNEQGDVGPYSNPMTEQTEEDCELFYKFFFKITTFSAVPGAVLECHYPPLAYSIIL